MQESAEARSHLGFFACAGDVERMSITSDVELRAVWLLDGLPAPFNPVPLGSIDRPEQAFIGCRSGSSPRRRPKGKKWWPLGTFFRLS